MPSRQDQIRRFSDLITTGQVRLGMNHAEVRSLLGEPDATGGTSRRNKNPGIYKYGDVELGFGKNDQAGLVLVYLDETKSDEFVTLLSERK